MRQWAREQGIHPATASRWLRSGTLPVPARRVGGRILGEDQRPPAGRTALPARGSAADRRPDPDRQVARIAA
ncbi:MAG TPA: IS607 family transposase, partial [Candidatus Dormibacteraeota bacterium]|nr:IS607 family transposase [Candidatus Dormibacteraeota bacterium]